MKRLFKSGALMLAAGAFALAGCGGGGGNGITSGYTALPVQGTISNLNYDGLVLLNNGGDAIAPPAKATTFSFPQQIKIGDAYAVTIRTQPLHQTCGIVGTGIDTSGRAVQNVVNLACSQNTYSLGGTVSNLVGDGLVLTNGSDQVTVAAGATSFVFPTLVADQSVYGVAVLTQPAGQTCTVVNGTAVMGSANVTSVQVACR
jgi:hypothetical protein